nr:60S ribosomal protein L13-like [Onthophagus taurus]
MVRHNNMISNNHFHKDWQKLIRIKLDQPMRKKRRNQRRIDKAKRLTPLPIDHLRPIVRCPSIRYHSKTRLGRGFSIKELKSAGINRNYAQTIGIAVDKRRRNVSLETLKLNVLRLQSYLARVEILKRVDPKMKVAVKCKEDDKKVKKKDDVKYEYVGYVKENVLVKNVMRCKAMVPTEEQKKFKVFETLRKARNEGRKLRTKMKKKEKENTFEFAK